MAGSRVLALLLVARSIEYRYFNKGWWIAAGGVQGGKNRPRELRKSQGQYLMVLRIADWAAGLPRFPCEPNRLRLSSFLSPKGCVVARYSESVHG